MIQKPDSVCQVSHVNSRYLPANGLRNTSIRLHGKLCTIYFSFMSWMKGWASYVQWVTTLEPMLREREDFVKKGSFDGACNATQTLMLGERERTFWPCNAATKHSKKCTFLLFWQQHIWIPSVPTFSHCFLLYPFFFFLPKLNSSFAFFRSFFFGFCFSAMVQSVLKVIKPTVGRRHIKDAWGAVGGWRVGGGGC